MLGEHKWIMAFEPGELVGKIADNDFSFDPAEERTEVRDVLSTTETRWERMSYWSYSGDARGGCSRS